MIDQQLAEIRGLQAAGKQGARAIDDDQLGYVLVTSAPLPPEDIAVWFAGAFQGIEIEVEPVFLMEKDPVHFLVWIARVWPGNLTGSPFEIAYAMEQAGPISLDVSVMHVEPVLELGCTGVQFDELAADKTRSGGVFGCFTDRNKKPTVGNMQGVDLDWVDKALRIREAKHAFGVTGEGITIAHIDTGIAEHVEIGNLSPDHGANLIEGGTRAVDPLSDSSGFWNPGHGTATSSVIFSLPAPDGVVDGVAPGADIYPVRAIRTVIRLAQWRVARAIDLAIEAGADIITMSLGGIWSWLLSDAVRRAEEKNILVLAAAGNCVKWVVYPARFSRCLSVAGTRPPTWDNHWTTEGRWQGTCRLGPVDICAPGQFVWCAAPKQGETCVGAGEGTSFAVALVAGIAALWLQRYGRKDLEADLGDATLLDLFKSELVRTSRKDVDLGECLENGIADAFALLKGPVPSLRNKTRQPLEKDDGTLSRQVLDMLAAIDPRSAEQLAETASKRSMETNRVALEMQWMLLSNALRASGVRTVPQATASTRLSQLLKDMPRLREAGLL
ncbi:MAG: S8/S53 family peptidase [Hyphomonas sp.]|nr:S8/S53 family peptidase [Hyphomonas sp.]